MFNHKQIASFKKQLLKRQRDLLDIKESSDEAARTVELDQTRMGRLTRMGALQGQAMAVELQRRQLIELQQISAALGRIDNGDYGYCLMCGEAIAIKRLELNPATPLCITCAEQSDKQ